MSYSRLGYPHSLSSSERSYVSAPINSGVPVLDQDVNLMQGIDLERMSVLFRLLFTAGWTSIDESDSLNDFTDMGNNNFRIVQPQHFIFNGLGITFAESFNETNTITTTSTSDPTDPVYDDNQLPLSVPSTHTDDLFFLEFWREEVDDVGTLYRYGNVNHYDPLFFSNDVIDPAVGDPATVRIQLRYRLRQVAGANHMRDLNVYIQGKKATSDKVRRWNYDAENNIYYHNTTESTVIGEFDDYDGIVYATPLCWTARIASDDDFADAVFTDYRQRVGTRVRQIGLPGEPTNPASPSLPGDPGEEAGVGGTTCQNVEVIGQLYSLEKVDLIDSANEVLVDFCNGNVHFVDLADATGDVTLTLEGGEPGGVYYISFKQHPVTPVQIIYPIDVAWVVGTAFELSEESEAVNIIMMIRTSNPAYRAIGYGENGLQSPPCQHDLTVVGDAEVDWSECDKWRLFLSAADDPFDLTLINPETGGFYILELVQGGTPVTVNWDPNMVWVEGDTFVLSTDISGVDLVFLYYDGTFYYSVGHGEKSKSYLELSDTTDTTYAGKATWVPQVNGGATALTLVSPAQLASSIFLTDLADVVTSTVAGEVLYYDGATWRNIVGATWSETYIALTNLSNVTLAGVVSGHVLQFNGSIWANATPAALAGSINLDDLANVTVPSPTSGNVLQYNGSVWVNVTPAAVAGNIALDDLSNVTVPSPSNTHVLQYNGSAWVNVTPASIAGNIALDDLSNVTVPSPSSTHVLQYNGSVWVNVSPATVALGINLFDLADANSSGGETATHILRYNSGVWTNAGIAAMTDAYVTLGNLSDVAYGSLVTGDVLFWNGGNWQNVAPTYVSQNYIGLDDLLNVAAGGDAPGDIIFWNGSGWQETAVENVTNGFVDLDDLKDCDVPSPSTGDVLTWNSTEWVAEAPSSTQTIGFGITFAGSGGSTALSSSNFTTGPQGIAYIIQTIEGTAGNPEFFFYVDGDLKADYIAAATNSSWAFIVTGLTPLSTHTIAVTVTAGGSNSYDGLVNILSF